MSDDDDNAKKYGWPLPRLRNYYEHAREPLINQGAITFEALEIHECSAHTLKRVSLASRNPAVWVLTLISSFGTFIELIHYCPYCGKRLDPPPPPLRICTCTHSERQHECDDPFLDKLGKCDECACALFEARG